MATNIFFMFLGFLLIDCDILALNQSKIRAFSDRIRESYRKTQQRGFKLKFRNNTFRSDETTKSPNQMPRMFYAPSLPVPRTQHISEESRHKVYGKLFARRNEESTRAGYTNDVNTCKIYNKNLEKVWSALSTIINTEQTPDHTSLHNIVLIISAYLEHHDIPTNDEPLIARTRSTKEIKHDAHDLDEIKEKAAKILAYHINIDHGPDETVSVIEDEIHFLSNKDKNCVTESQNKLRLKVEKEYQKYLNHSNCLYLNNDKEILLESNERRAEIMSMDEAKEFVNDWTRRRKAKCKLLALETFDEIIIRIVKEYEDDLQMCKTPA